MTAGGATPIGCGSATRAARPEGGRGVGAYPRVITRVVLVDVGTVEAYDPTTLTWTAKAPMPTPRTLLAAGVIDGLIYAVGGYNGVALGTGKLAEAVLKKERHRFGDRRKRGTRAVADLVGMYPCGI